MAAPASDSSDASAAAIEQLYQFGERLNESKDKSKVRAPLIVCQFFACRFVVGCSFWNTWGWEFLAYAFVRCSVVSFCVFVSRKR